MFAVRDIAHVENCASGPARVRLAARRRRAAEHLRRRFGDNSFARDWSTKRLPWETR